MSRSSHYPILPFPQLKPHGITVTVCYPPDTQTPGFQEENKTKPVETRLISEAAGLFTVCQTIRGGLGSKLLYSMSHSSLSANMKHSRMLSCHFKVIFPHFSAMKMIKFAGNSKTDILLPISPAQSDEVAKKLVDDALQGRFSSTVGLEGFMLTTLCAGMGPITDSLSLLAQVPHTDFY